MYTTNTKWDSNPYKIHVRVCYNIRFPEDLSTGKIEYPTYVSKK